MTSNGEEFLNDGLPARVESYPAPWGIYIRWPLALLAALLAIWFGRSVLTEQTGILCLVATIVLLLSVLTMRGIASVRGILLIAMTLNVFSQAINPNDSFGNRRTPTETGMAYLLFGCLLTASALEIAAWVRSSSRTAVLKSLAWGALAIPALGYIVGIPLFQIVWDTFEADEKKLALKDPNWNVVNEMTFRAAKFFVFSVFTYLGACLGSFLNVVAYCLPRGEAIGIRDSKCPQCDTKIRRTDNLPIFSYINLGAACRNCRKHIPSRYLIVELVVAAIFGSLFLYQLVTGCVNVPEVNILHKGILWIILYPKWPAIGLYLFHVAFLSAIVVLALIERDQQSLKLSVAIPLGLLFFLSAAVYLPLQPIPLLEQLPFQRPNWSPWIEQFVKLTIGGLLGAAIGHIAGSITRLDRRSTLTMAFCLSGVVLGWQALLEVTVIFSLLFPVYRFFSKFNRSPARFASAILFVAIFVHHPFWKTIANLWKFG